jgi:DNA-binding SARP family transcriptional activator
LALRHPSDAVMPEAVIATQDPAHPGRVQLCGRFVVELDGKRIEDELPGRQGRVLFAHLATNRLRPIGRDELIDALWPTDVTNGADASLSALLSKIRRALGEGRLEGRTTLQLQLPRGTLVDLEAASEALHRAESALARRDLGGAWAAARVPLHIAIRRFLPGEEAPWIDDVRRHLEEMYVRSLEITAEASLGLGGTELDTAERSARSLVKVSPYRESGYRYLMQTLDTRGNRAEALRIYEELRTLLRDELGASPSGTTQELHRALLGA